MDIEYGTARALQSLWEIETAIKNTTDDGILYEDHLVIVRRTNGQITMEGKPIRECFFYV